jgi:hypothetical protein
MWPSGYGGALKNSFLDRLSLFVLHWSNPRGFESPRLQKSELLFAFFSTKTIKEGSFFAYRWRRKTLIYHCGSMVVKEDM